MKGYVILCPSPQANKETQKALFKEEFGWNGGRTMELQYTDSRVLVVYLREGVYRRVIKFSSSSLSRYAKDARYRLLSRKRVLEEASNGSLVKYLRSLEEKE